jgi:hypothetical protein
MLLLLIVWPFGAFLYALYNYDERESKAVFIVFTALFGYSMVAESSGLDLYRVLLLLPEAYHQSLGTYLTYRGVNESVDIYRDAVTFIVSRLTNNPRWLMLSFGLVAGYVYTKTLSLFTSEFKGKNIFTYILVITFSCIIGMDSIAGVRFGLAAYVFFFGAIKVINTGDKRYLLVAFLSVLIHFSFLAAVLLLVAFIFFRFENYPKAIYVILILSFFLPDLMHSFIIKYSGVFGSGIKARTELYSNLGEDMDLKNTVWFVRLRIIVMMVFCYLTFFVTRMKKKNLYFSEKLNRLFFFSLIMLSFINFTMDIPHFGYRFQFIFLIFAFYYLYKIYTENPESVLVTRLVWISLPFSMLMMFYTARSILSISSMALYYFSLPGLFFDHSSHSAWTSIMSFRPF